MCLILLHPQEKDFRVAWEGTKEGLPREVVQRPFSGSLILEESSNFYKPLAWHLEIQWNLTPSVSLSSSSFLYLLHNPNSVH